MKLFWGDLHNHCGISYGYGSLENALKAAKEQLDFCAVIGHASWHDIPEATPELEYKIEYHQNGFEKLAGHWEKVREKVKEANVPHEFVTFQGYEAHSRRYGDHHFLSTDDDLPLITEGSPKEIMKRFPNKNVIAVPHHVGYTPGYRGANWEAFDERTSPIVEVFSKHGSGMSDKSSYPYYHSMGPRDSRSTVYTALEKGHRFGFVGSTDHHAGYPGSYGDGRLAVLASEKTRESIWEALLARRTYAVTGDKIECLFKINGEYMGSEIDGSGTRNIELSVKGDDRIDKIVVYKNLKPWKIINGETFESKKVNVYKIRVEMGWGSSKNEFPWEGEIKIDGGHLVSVEPCFRGRSVLAPSPDMNDDDDLNNLNNKIINQTDNQVTWSCTTFKNPTPLHAHTASLVLEINGDDQSNLQLNINGKKMEVALKELLSGSRSAQLKPHTSEAFLVHGAIPEDQYTFSGEWTDRHQETDCDIYHVEVKQMNNQWAWISPIYALA